MLIVWSFTAKELGAFSHNSFRIYCAYLSERKAGVRVRGGQRAFKDGEVDEARRQIVRYIRKARKIAENVGRGEFPGKY